MLGLRENTLASVILSTTGGRWNKEKCQAELLKAWAAAREADVSDAGPSLQLARCSRETRKCSKRHRELLRETWEAELAIATKVKNDATKHCICRLLAGTSIGVKKRWYNEIIVSRPFAEEWKRVFVDFVEAKEQRKSFEDQHELALGCWDANTEQACQKTIPSY